MKPEIKNKIDFMISRHEEQLRIRIDELANSGGLNMSEYNEKDYILPKILITAALRDCKDIFLPIHPQFRRDCDKLKHF